MVHPKYQTFWKRFFAGIVDGIVFLPFTLLDNYFAGSSLSAYILWEAFYLVAWAAYMIIGHGKYGQTLGKRAMNIKVLDLDEKNTIGYKRAFYRESVWILADLIGVVLLILISAGKIELSGDTDEYWYFYIINYAITAWFLVELITMLFNDKRRAVHDFMAGSVVVDLSVVEREKLENH